MADDVRLKELNERLVRQLGERDAAARQLSADASFLRGELEKAGGRVAELSAELELATQRSRALTQQLAIREGVIDELTTKVRGGGGG
jgi:phage-related minor tail protein